MLNMLSDDDDDADDDDSVFYIPVNITEVISR